MMDFKEPRPKPRFDWQLVGMIALPVLAVAVVTGAVAMALGDRMYFGWALLIGLVL